MSPEEGGRSPLEWEARWGTAAGYAAFAAAALLLTSFAYRVSTIPPAPPKPAAALGWLAAQSAPLLFLTALQGAGFLCAGAALYYLYRVVRHRRPLTPAASGVLALAGPLILVAGLLATHVLVTSTASSFLVSGPRTDARALELLQGTFARVLFYVRSAGWSALAFASVLISINGLRAGILSRFLGILGVILGVLYVLPIPPGPTVLQVLWFVALGGLFSGRWPGGRGPAWETGEATPWPGSAERRAALEAPEGSGGTATEHEPGNGPSEESGPRKRKRKRRR